MVTKGIVTKIITPYQIQVRMPTLNGLANSKDGTPDERLDVATICTLPNTNINLSIGDIVFVAFEDNDLSKPIIIGLLFKETNTYNSANVMLNYLEVILNSKLPFNTYIGEVSPEEISYLKGVQGNIQLQINNLQKQINDLKEK